MGKRFTKRSGVLLTEVQLQNIFHLGEELIRVTQFQLFLFILFILMKSKPEIEGMTTFDWNYLYSAYADDTIFLLKDIISVKHMADISHFFFELFGIKTKFNKI